MFSSTNNGNGISLPHLSPCFNLTDSLVGFSDDEVLLHHHHDLLSHCLLESPANKSTSISPETYRSNGDHSPSLHTHRRWKSQKKDRHSKIFTAQGPRERRVRLSKDIARKFFDLQDLLGFDKASKTLDWLLGKSKTAIKELRQIEHIDDQSTKSLCSSEYENLDTMGSTASERKRMGKPVKHKEAKGPQKAEFDTLKELRVKARARARERTKEKNFLRKLSEAKIPTDLIPPIPNQPRPWSQIGYCKISDSNCHSAISSVNINTGINGSFCYGPQIGGEVDAEEIFKESVMIKRKLKPSYLFAFQPNRIISTESSSNFCQWAPSTTENWDISSTITSSSLCALTNIISSRVLQISGKPFDFEEYINNNRD